MGRIRAVKQSGRRCRLCRRKGGFRTVYCVHGTGSAFVEGIGHLFDPRSLTISDKDTIWDLKSHRGVSPGEVVRRSQVRRVIGNLLAAQIGQRGGVGESD